MPEPLTKFSSSLSNWTLFFHNPEYESGFRNFLREKAYYNCLLKYILYFGIASNIFLHALSIISIYTTNFAMTPGIHIELGLTVAFIAVFTLEGALRRLGIMKLFHGFFIYTLLPINTITMAFNMSKAPLFDIPYFFGYNEIGEHADWL